MLAVDTNVVVRIVVAADDPAQAAKANALFAAENIFIPMTVLLESAWVLRHSYRVSALTIAAAYRALAGLPNVQIENPERLLQALGWAENGLDFADALHLASAADCDAFATFDKSFIKAAKALRAPEVRLP